MKKKTIEQVRKIQKVSLTLYLKQPAYDKLTELVELSGAGSKAEVVRRSLECFEKQLRTKRENKE